MTSSSRNRPAFGEPVQLDCQLCGQPFIGASRHALCAACANPTVALNDVLRGHAERLEKAGVS